LLQTREKVELFIEKVTQIKASLKNQEDRIKAFKEFVEEMIQTEAEGSAARDEENKRVELTVEDSNWSKEDIALLTKAIVRFPPGTARRWEVIADFCGNRKQKDVIKKAQELKNKRELELQMNREAEERKNEERKAMLANATAAAAQANAAAAAPQRAAKGKKKPLSKPASEDAPASEAVDAEGWTSTQQTQMEAAMKKFPGSMPAKERWIAIAELVEGKTAKDCFTRFKSIVAKLKSDGKNQ